MSCLRLRPRTFRFMACMAAALACGACSVLFAPNEEQCATDGDCQAKGAAFSGMRCVENACVASGISGGDSGGEAGDAGADVDPAFACASLPVPSPDPSKQVEMTMRYTDFSTGQPPVVSTLVRLCAATDPNCVNARSTLSGKAAGDAGADGGSGWVIPNTDGTVTAKVEFGFEGFFEARSDQYPPTFRSTSPALRNPKNEFEQLLLRPGEISFLADQLLGKPDSYDSKGHGLVFVFARDCNQQPIAGASFTTTAEDPLLVPFYVINSSPSVKDDKTDSLGRGGYLNVPPGIHTFTGFIGSGAEKKRFGSGRVLVRAGAATTIAVSPTP
ncbi:MAG: hypothetical protein JST00_10275 [Deltaproteobacteria bacterium]|nr:hypothetical protein [Deltaproteobacteria bacterium]